MTEFVTKLDDQVQEIETDMKGHVQSQEQELIEVHHNIMLLSDKLNEVALKCGVQPTIDQNQDKTKKQTNETVPAERDSVRGMEVD